jgi:hypothetical protein
MTTHCEINECVNFTCSSVLTGVSKKSLSDVNGIRPAFSRLRATLLMNKKKKVKAARKQTAKEKLLRKYGLSNLSPKAILKSGDIIVFDFPDKKSK